MKGTTVMILYRTFTSNSIPHNIMWLADGDSRGGGGCSAKEYIPQLGRQRETPSLSGQPYPYRHKVWTHKPTLCGTEFGQNGTLAVLAYAYWRQWEYPPPPGYSLMCYIVMFLGRLLRYSNHFLYGDIVLSQHYWGLFRKITSIIAGPQRLNFYHRNQILCTVFNFVGTDFNLHHRLYHQDKSFAGKTTQCNEWP